MRTVYLKFSILLRRGPGLGQGLRRRMENVFSFSQTGFQAVVRDFDDFLATSSAKYCERGAVNQSAASAASPDYVKFQAVMKSAASGASPRGGCASGRLDHRPFVQFLGALVPKQS